MASMVHLTPPIQQQQHIYWQPIEMVEILFCQAKFTAHILSKSTIANFIVNCNVIEERKMF